MPEWERKFTKELKKNRILPFCKAGTPMAMAVAFELWIEGLSGYEHSSEGGAGHPRVVKTSKRAAAEATREGKGLTIANGVHMDL